MIRAKTYLTGLLLATTLHFNCLSTSARTVTFDDVLTKTVDNSFDLKISTTDLGISKTAVKEAKSEYYPNLSLLFDQEYLKGFHQKENAIGFIGNNFVNSNTRFQNYLSARMDYNLFDFGIRKKKLKIAKTDVLEKKYEYNQKLRDLKLKALELYSNSLLSYKEIKIKEEILPIYKEIFTIKEKLYESKVSSKLDIMEEAIKIARMLDGIEEAGTRLKSNLEDLSAMTLEDYDTDDIDLVDLDEQAGSDQEISDTGVFKQRIEQKSIAIPEFVNENTYEYKIAQMEILKKQQELVILNRQRLPQFRLYANYVFYGSNMSDILQSYQDFKDRNTSVGISVNIPIFDGFKNSAQRDRARLEIEKLKLEQEKNSLEIQYKFKKLNKLFESYKKELDKKESIISSNKEKLNALDRLSKYQLVDKSTYLEQKAEMLNCDLELEKTKINILSTLMSLEMLSEDEE